MPLSIFHLDSIITDDENDNQKYLYFVCEKLEQKIDVP